MRQGESDDLVVRNTDAIKRLHRNVGVCRRDGRRAGAAAARPLLARGRARVSSLSGVLENLNAISSNEPALSCELRERVRSGEAKPRLRRAPFQLRDNEPETFIWYEPVRDTCRLEFERYGLVGQPGGHIFVLRTATGKLEDLN